MLEDLKLNTNLFKVFCIPLFKMGAINAMLAVKSNKEKFLTNLRAKAKRFCLIPQNTPH